MHVIAPAKPAHSETVQRFFRGALADIERGRLAQARNGCASVLALEPDHVEALHALGIIAYREGDIAGAAGWLRRALERASARADILNNLANLLAESGDNDEAARLLERAIRCDPEFAAARNNLGNLRRDRGEPLAAETLYREAQRLDPSYAAAHHNLGLALEDQGRSHEAIASYLEAIRLQPDNARSRNNVGLLLHKQGDCGAAEGHLRAAVRADPADPDARNNLGNLLHDEGLLEEALVEYREALRLRPGSAPVLANLGAAYHDQGRFDDAIAAYRAGLAQAPGDAGLHHNLGAVLQDAGRPEQAEAGFREALRLDSGNSAALGALAFWLQRCCAWDEVRPLAAALFSDHHLRSGRMAPFALMSFSASPAELRRAAEAHVAAEYSKVVPLPRRPLLSGRPRVGYLSSDFREHPVAYLMAELFELHDPARVEVFAYSCQGAGSRSAVRERIRGAARHFVDVEPLSPHRAARRIVEDGIDILVDLSGHTQFARGRITALRPAPVQVNFLGYPGTLGAPYVDYILTDRFVTPPQAQEHFSEKFVYLPHCYQPNDRRKEIAEAVGGRTQCGLPREGFVFCSFNKSYKLTPGMFAVWMRLLKAVAGSVLWLSDASATAMENLRREAQRQGVDAQRLVFAPRVDTVAEHLGRHRHADLFLDTLPYNAHTTASDALWAGLPVVTCAGETFAGRVAGSLLNAIGLPELVTDTLADYEALALRLAREPGLLAGLKARLEQNRLTWPLFDSARYTRDLERAYELMWERYRRGEAPGLIEVPA